MIGKENQEKVRNDGLRAFHKPARHCDRSQVPAGPVSRGRFPVPLQQDRKIEPRGDVEVTGGKQKDDGKEHDRLGAMERKSNGDCAVNCHIKHQIEVAAKLGRLPGRACYRPIEAVDNPVDHPEGRGRPVRSVRKCHRGGNTDHGSGNGDVIRVELRTNRPDEGGKKLVFAAAQNVVKHESPYASRLARVKRKNKRNASPLPPLSSILKRVLDHGGHQ